MINKDRLIRLTQDLIRINSENPNGDEFEIAHFVNDYFKKIKIKTKFYEFEKRRLNILAYLPGKNSKKSLLITPHLDTVPAGTGWTKDAFAAKIEDGKIYGLGATDCKCNLSAAMEAMNSLVEDKVRLDYNLIFAATADEESGSDTGLIPLLDKGILKPTHALVLDADDFEVVVAQKGLLHITVKIKGKKAHGAYPWLGKNAIDISLNILKDVKEYIANVVANIKMNPYLKEPTVNIGTIKGGDKVNVVADWCQFELDFRYLPVTKAQEIINNLKRICKKHAKSFEVIVDGVQSPYCISESHGLVKQLVSAIKKVGAKPFINGSEGATVITFFQHKGIPAIATGFGVEGLAHTVNEYVKIDTLFKGTQALEIFLKEYKFD